MTERELAKRIASSGDHPPRPGGQLRQGGWKRLQMVERYSHAIPVTDRAALPNPMAEARIVSFSREAKVV